MSAGHRIPFVLALALATALPISAARAESTGFPVEDAYAAVSAGDIATAVGYLTDDAMFAVVPASSRMPAPALVGKKEIGAWWTGTHADGGRVEFADLRIDGDRATFTCRYHGNKLASLGVSPAEFDGLAILRDGRIRVLVWSYSAEYEPRLKAALARISQ